MTPHYEPGEPVWIYPPKGTRYGATIDKAWLVAKGTKAVNTIGKPCTLARDYWYYTLSGEDPDALYAEWIIRKRYEPGRPFCDILATIKNPLTEARGKGPTRGG